MEDPLDIYQDVIDISSDDEEVTEADNYPQKDEMSDREWRDELDDIRSEINRESYAREDAINPDAKLDTFTTPFLEEEDRFRNDRDFNNPALEVEDDEEDEEEIIMSLPAVEGEFMKLKDAIHISDPNDLPELSRLTGYSEAEIDRMMYAFAVSGVHTDDDPYLENTVYVQQGLDTFFESKAHEDFGSNTIQGDDLITDGYPTDQEGFGRASWDDATIEDRKNWLSVNGFNTDDAWSPYYSLDSYIRSNLAKDLHVGGIKAMGSTY